MHIFRIFSDFIFCQRQGGTMSSTIEQCIAGLLTSNLENSTTERGRSPRLVRPDDQDGDGELRRAGGQKN